MIAFLLLILLLVISLLIVGSIYVANITAFVRQHLPQHGDDGEQLVLWIGMLLSAFAFGLLTMYLLLK